MKPKINEKTNNNHTNLKNNKDKINIIDEIINNQTISIEAKKTMITILKQEWSQPQSNHQKVVTK